MGPRYKYIYDYSGSVQTIEVPMLQAWKMCFVADTIMVCGELGRVLAYDLFSK